MLLPHDRLERVLGDRTAKALNKHLGLETVADLLQHYPRRYFKRGELTNLSAVPVGEPVTVLAEVVDVRERRMKGRVSSILEVRITDGEGTLTLTFFNQAWRQKDLQPGTQGLFAGKITSFQRKLQLAHPDYELFTDDPTEAEAKRWSEQPIPIYPAAAGASTWMIQRALSIVIDTLPTIPTAIPAELLAEQNLFSEDEAIRKIHQPENDQDWQLARDSLKYAEALSLQLALMRRKKSRKALLAPVCVAGEFVARFESALPFEFTGGQREVIREIDADLGRSEPMTRLLQGEVGTGKTIVALRAMLVAADSQGQAVLLAPTEVLASQHYASIRQMLGEDLSRELGVTLLTGQLSASEKKSALLHVASGKAQIVVGTHALIASGVSFAELKLVVVDEQHRFGVEQRETLRGRGATSAHLLAMTATPIPRTLAISVFGDLEISTLRELPRGRQPITTHLVRLSESALVARVWQRIAEEVEAGRQAFVVCPRISEDEAEEGFSQLLEIEVANELSEIAAPKAKLASVVGTNLALAKNSAVAKLSRAVLHGKMTSDEKAEVMQDFQQQKTKILISTTVIEVGVDVPNATVMVVLDADRFGISQLHQLRGRIGRGKHPGLCLLLSGAEPGSTAFERLSAVAASTDGFELSQKDLELRGEGDVVGQMQSGGKSTLKILRVIQDASIIEAAREDAEQLMATDPDLKKSPNLLAAIEEFEAEPAQNLAKT